MDENEEVNTVDKNEEEAAFLAEMAELPVEDAIAPTVDGEQEVNNEASSETDETPQEVDEVVATFAGYTEDEIKGNFAQLAKLQKSLDTTNGTFGSKFAQQQATIEALQANNGNAHAALSPEVLERLNEEFPELAEIFSGGVETDSGIQTEQAPDVEPQRSQADERVDAFIAQQTEREQGRETRMLMDKHSDWKEIAMFNRGENGIIQWNDPSFGQFVANLPQDEQNTLLNVWDADFVGDVITAYKASLPEHVTEQKIKRKKPSLESALRPDGLNGQVSLSPADEEEAAFLAEMAST